MYSMAIGVVSGSWEGGGQERTKGRSNARRGGYGTVRSGGP